MNAYQLWKMTANPIDPDKRVRVKKLFATRSKKYVRKPRTYTTRRLSFPFEKDQTLTSKKRHAHHLKETDTILQQSDKYKIKEEPRFIDKENAKNATNIVNFCGLQSADKRPKKRKIVDKHQTTDPILQNQKRYELMKRPTMAPKNASSTSVHLKYRRNASPKRNATSMKWLMQNNANNDSSASPTTKRKRKQYRPGPTRRLYKTNQTVSQPLFTPMPIEQRTCDDYTFTRQRVMGF